MGWWNVSVWLVVFVLVIKTYTSAIHNFDLILKLRIKCQKLHQFFDSAGGFPYPTTSNRDLPEMLRSGYRMDKPETCSLEV